MNKEKQIILENISKFKKEFEKYSNIISYEDFNKYFYIESHFKGRETVYFEEDFFEVIFQMTNTIIKGIIQNLEHYVNIRPQTPQMTSDYDILKNDKEMLKLYYKFHILNKKTNLIYLNFKINSVDVMDVLKETFDVLKEYYEYTIGIEGKLEENLKVKLNKIGNKDENKIIESSVYN